MDERKLIQGDERESNPPLKKKTLLGLSLRDLGLCVFFAVLALLSFFVLPGIFATPEFWSATAQSIDSTCETVMKLIGAAAGAATVVAAIPGDATTPIALELADLGGNLALVLSALYLEKYLLIVLSKAALMVLVPVGCAVAVLAIVASEDSKLKAGAVSAASKLFLFALAGVLVVPSSVLVSDLVRDAYEEFGEESAIEQALVDGDPASDVNKDLADEAQESEAAAEDSASVLGRISKTLKSTVDDAADDASSLAQWASEKLNHFIEAFAVMVVTCCVVPILVIVFFLWMVNTLLGLDIRPSRMPKVSNGVKRMRPRIR